MDGLQMMPLSIVPSRRGSLRDQEEYLYIKICDFLTKGLSNHSSKELHKKGTSHNEHVNPSQYYFYGKNHKS
jgi:hypothetical protein